MSQYAVYVIPSAWREIKALPGHMRQRVKRAVDDLADNPRPPESQILSMVDIEPTLEAESVAWRLRLDKWRIIYVVHESAKVIDVLAVRKRPPYDYGDLAQLLANNT